MTINPGSTSSAIDRPRSWASGSICSTIRSQSCDTSIGSSSHGAEFGFQAGQHQQVTHQPDQPLHFGLDAVESGTIGIGVALALAHHIQPPLQGRERRAQLVRGVGHEAALAGERCLEPRQHVVERGGEPAQLVVRPAIVQPRAEIAGAHRARELSHAIDRTHRQARQSIAGEARDAERHRHRPQQREIEAVQRLLDGIDRKADGQISDGDAVVPDDGLPRHAPMLFGALEIGLDSREAHGGGLIRRQLEGPAEPRKDLP